MYSASHTEKTEPGANRIAIDCRLNTLKGRIIDILEDYGEPSLMGHDFCSIIGDENGQRKLDRLLEAAGHPDDPEGFVKNLLEQLLKSKRRPVTLDKVVMPHLLLVSLLELLMPGDGFFSVTNTRELENLTNQQVPDHQKKTLNNVIDRYPVRLSMHVIRQAYVSHAVARQYFPFVEELDSKGRPEIWVGRFQKGILERMYRNRVVFLLHMNCPVYCRFCFRKHKDSRKADSPSTDDVAAAVEYVKHSAPVKEVLITGGDPFLSRQNMDCAINGLINLPQVQTLRLATRSIAYYPRLLTHGATGLSYIKGKNRLLCEHGKRLEIATHFIHPDEISPESLDIITHLTASGVIVYVQTPLLSGCNDKAPDLARLFRLLRGAGAELHYIFMPCSPIQGNRIYSTTISTGIKIAGYLRAHLSDRALPKMSTATSIGKVEWHTSGWAVEQDASHDDCIWIRTSYTPDYFKEFAPLENNLDGIRVNQEGTLDIRFMAAIGDDALFLGPRPQSQRTPKHGDGQASWNEFSDLLRTPRPRCSIVQTGQYALSRTHETCVEIDSTAGPDTFHYIRQDERITDVIITLDKVDTDSLCRIEQIVQSLYGLWHVNAVRLRWAAFTHTPTACTSDIIETLGRLNKLSLANPQKLEIETEFLRAAEITREHALMTRRLNNQGIAVYNNTPLLGGINDSPDDMVDLAFCLRRAGIEFHHLYVAGLPVQNQWNRTHPITTGRVIDIASMVRREGSGREIPRYIIHTPLGEADYGLTSSLIDDDGCLAVKLACYDRSYYQAMDPSFNWPENVTTDTDGKPIIPVTGLIRSVRFPV